MLVSFMYNLPYYFIDCLREHKHELSHYGQKINIILSKLRKQITLCRQQIG